MNYADTKKNLTCHVQIQRIKMEKHLQNYIVTKTPQKQHTIPADVFPKACEDLFFEQVLVPWSDIC